MFEELKAKDDEILELFKMCNEKDKEIERLNKEREIDIKYNKYLQKELAKANSIIKEVREYIKENTTSYYTDLEQTNEEFELVGDPKELLEILDKLNKEE